MTTPTASTINLSRIGTLGSKKARPPLMKKGDDRIVLIISLDPTMLAMIGIAITVLATGLTLFKGN